MRKYRFLPVKLNSVAVLKDIEAVKYGLLKKVSGAF